MNAASVRTALSRYGMIAALVLIAAIVLFEARRTTSGPAPAPPPAGPAAGAPAAAPPDMAAVRTFLPAAPASYHVDVAAFGGKQVVFSGTRQPHLTAAPGQAVTFGGWAVDREHNALSGGIALLVDGKTRVAGRTGGPRPDVASALGSPALTNCAFEATVPPALLGRGGHRVSLLILAAGGKAFYQAKDLIRIEVR